MDIEDKDIENKDIEGKDIGGKEEENEAVVEIVAPSQDSEEQMTNETAQETADDHDHSQLHAVSSEEEKVEELKEEEEEVEEDARSSLGSYASTCKSVHGTGLNNLVTELSSWHGDDDEEASPMTIQGRNDTPILGANPATTDFDPSITCT